MSVKVSEENVINNITHFIQNNMLCVEKCYNSIIDGNNFRHFHSKLKKLDNAEFDKFLPLVSSVIMTANKFECDSLNYIASKKQSNSLRMRKDAYQLFEDVSAYTVDAYVFKFDKYYILHLNTCETGSYTPGGSSDLVRFINNNKFIHPISIISFGICYGTDPKTQNIGDVLIPKKLYPWSIGQKVHNNKLEIKSDNFNFWLENSFLDSDIYSTLRRFCGTHEGSIINACVEMSNEKCEFNTRVFWGNMSTGEAVISSGKFKKKIVKANHNYDEIGGEMEGYGLAKECIYYSKTPCFIVKAICDWGELKNIDKELGDKGLVVPNNFKDKLQAYSSFSAGLVLFKLLEENKSVFSKNKFIEWIKNSPKNTHISELVGKEKKIIIKKIRLFYDVGNADAEIILETMLNNKVINTVPSISSNGNSITLYIINS